MFLIAVALVGAFSAADVRGIRQACAAPKSWLVKKHDGSVLLKPPRGADYQKVDCLLKEIRALSVKRGASPSMGFVGAERFN